MGVYKSFTFPKIPLSESISIISGNTKLLSVPNTSFPPIVTCNKDAPCAIKGCYILNGMYWPSQQRTYEKNYNIYQQSSGKYYDFLNDFLKTTSPEMFRFMVSGDIPDYTYFNLMRDLATNHIKTNFLCYSKQYYTLIRSIGTDIPTNLRIFASAWPKFNLPPLIRSNFRIAWMQDGNENRIPKTKKVFKCSGYCEKCKFCYSPLTKSDVVFMKH